MSDSVSFFFSFQLDESNVSMGTACKARVTSLVPPYLLILINVIQPEALQITLQT